MLVWGGRSAFARSRSLPRSSRSGLRVHNFPGGARRRGAGVLTFGECILQRSRNIAREAERVGIVEDDSVAESHFALKGAFKSISQFDSHQRVHTKVEEAGLWVGGVRQAEHRLELALQESDEQVFALASLRVL